MKVARLLGAALACSAVAGGPAGAAEISFAECHAVAMHGGAFQAAELDGRPGLDLLGASGSEVQIRPYAGARSFGDPTTIAMGAPVRRLAAADVDGDGRSDLVAVTHNPVTVRVRLNLGGLTFGPEQTRDIAHGLAGLAAGDLNGDGRADVAVACSDSVVVLIAGTDGSLERADVKRGTPTQYALFPAIGDLDGDGVPDLIVPGSDSVSWRVDWLRGHGDGTFDGPATLATATYAAFVALPADLDRDGDLDLAYGEWGAIRWLENDGAGGFAESDTLLRDRITYMEPYPSCGDIDADGWPDLVWHSTLRSGPQYKCVTVVYAAGHPQRRASVMWHAPWETYFAAIADLDQDGWPEVLAGVNPYDGRGAGIFWGAGDGALLGRGVIPVWAVYGVDWGGGGIVAARPGTGMLPDLVAAPLGRMRLLRNRGNGTFLPADDFTRGTAAAAGDLDGNGIDEVIVTRGDTVQVYRRATSEGPFVPQGHPFVGERFGGLSDVDADGHLDLVLDSGHSLTIRRGDGGGGFGSPSPLVSFPVAHGALLFRDLDANGAPELVWADASALRVGSHEVGEVRVALHVQRNDGHGGFAPAATDTLRFAGHHTLATSGSRLDAGDVDGDGDPDVVLSMGSGGSSTNWFGAFLNDGTGRLLASPISYIAGWPGGFMNVRDLDRDGMADVILHDSDGYDFDMRVAPAIGGGAFGPLQWFESATSCGGMAAEDFDGDGLCDVAAVDGEMGGLVIHRNVTPLPPPTPALAAFSAARFEDGAIALEWSAPGVGAFTASIERALDDGPWATLAAVAADGTGRGAYFDRDLSPGRRHGYRLRYDDGGLERASAEAWVDVPRLALALRGPFPNPADAAPRFEVELPAHGEASLEVFDVAGRRVWSRPPAALAAGRHRVALDRAALAPGLYLARLRSGAGTAALRFVVVR